jgi:hypothetical protein
MVAGRYPVTVRRSSNFEIRKKAIKSPEKLAPDLLSVVDDGQTIPHHLHASNSIFLDHEH